MEIGLFLTKHRGAIDFIVNVDALAEEYSYLPLVKIYDDFFSSEEHQDLLSNIQRSNLDGLVLAGYSKNFYLKTLGGQSFINRITSLGINPNYIGFADIGEYIAFSQELESSPFSFQRGWANVMARTQIGMELLRISNALPAKIVKIPPYHKVAILGLNINSLITAWMLLKIGFKIKFIFSESELSNIYDVCDKTPFLSANLLSDPQIENYPISRIDNFYGHKGKYKLDIFLEDGNKEQIIVGGLVITDEKYLDQIPCLNVLYKEKMFQQAFDINTELYLLDDSNSFETVVFLLNDSQELLKDKIDNSMQASYYLSSLVTEEFCQYTDNSSRVDINRCAGCGICLKVCPTRASYMLKGQKYSKVDFEKCQSCGACVAVCPNEARDNPEYTQRYYKQVIKYLANTTHLEKHLILLIFCEQYYQNNMQIFNSHNHELLESSAFIIPISINCLLRLDAQFIIQALLSGFSGVLSASCVDEYSHYFGALKVIRNRMRSVQEILIRRGIEPERVKLVEIFPDKDKRLKTEITDFIRQINEIGKRKNVI